MTISSDADIVDDCSRAERTILANIDIDESDKTSSIAQAVSGSDVAEVRLNADPESVEASKTRRYDESLVCPLMTTAAADLSKKSLVVLNDTLVKEKPEPAREQAQTFHLPRAEEPYNEFVDNGKMLMECFPHLFVRGQGATYVKGSWHGRPRYSLWRRRPQTEGCPGAAQAARRGHELRRVCPTISPQYNIAPVVPTKTADQ